MNERLLEKVYANDGEFLGSQYINLEGLQGSSKEAILHILYLDIAVDELMPKIKNGECGSGTCDCLA